MSEILEILHLTPSEQSLDYVQNKQQFHLFNLLTEQRHPNTWNLSFTLDTDIAAGLRMLLSVDQDIERRIEQLRMDPLLLESAIRAVVEAIRSGRRIYIYGCGATGRLAKQMESTFWRPFWNMAKAASCWSMLQRSLPPNIEEYLVGEMTGADRALVSSLEGFEDLQMLGRLQLEDHGISCGDVVICVTEGGETSSVIGTILGALAQYGELDEAKTRQAREHLYFIYNNPDDVLRPFHRSVAVIDNPAIAKINLATGPQGITGSTRLQATTSETFVVGVILEEALYRFLSEKLDADQLRELGFRGNPGLACRLGAFKEIRKLVDAAVPQLTRFTQAEIETYRNGRFSTYFAKTALITVFIDNTERSPTFRLFPLDKADDPERHCWVQVWTEAADRRAAWHNFLGRPFCGMESGFYKQPFEKEVEDPYLRQAALRSLTQAGNDQELCYDFSFSAANVEKKGPQPGDLGVLVLVDKEVEELRKAGSSTHQFLELCRTRYVRVAIVLITAGDLPADLDWAAGVPDSELVLVRLVCDESEDPITLRRQIALKMLLNAHSTAIMASLGKVIGNTMTNVSPSNLKLIGRATFLILSHVNDTLRQPEWTAAHGVTEPVTFTEANAVLFDAIEYVQSSAAAQTAEVALSIIRILEALNRKSIVSWEDARAILDQEGLAKFLLRLNPALANPGYL
jgi:N-acetylmuramic acid 6-phosphate etherase